MGILLWIMNFKKMVESAKEGSSITIPINSFAIKNKGSVAKIGDVYANFYNDLIEKWSIKCTETKFIKNDLDQTAQAMLWDWHAYSKIDDFARVKFEFNVNAWRISGDSIQGLFKVKNTMELDYNGTWRKNSFTKWYLPIYLRTYYQSKLLGWLGKHMEDLNSIKEKLMDRLNMNVYD